MSKMKTDRKPPLAKSPIRVRPRRALRSSDPTSLQTPPGSLSKSQKPIRSLDVEESDLRPEYRSISCELRALAEMVQDELGEGKAGMGVDLSANSSSVFERGRFYEEYSARRNERLKRKKGETGDVGQTTSYSLGVTIESSKKRESKKLESLRKSISAAYSVEGSEPRYMLRSMTKENKKPPLPFNSVNPSERKTATRRVRKI